MKLCLAILLIATSPSALALINGIPLIGKPDVVRLVFTNGWMCSGTFIDPYTILTAAHCITSEAEPLHLEQVLSENDENIQVKQHALHPHPDYNHQSWPAFDVGIIKTSENSHFKGTFQLEKTDRKIFGRTILIGTGKTNLESGARQRSSGRNSYLRLGSLLFFLGLSHNSADPGTFTTVAPNDSGGPVIDEKSGHIIGVMTTTTSQESARFGLATLSTATSTISKENLEFILNHLGPSP